MNDEKLDLVEIIEDPQEEMKPTNNHNNNKKTTVIVLVSVIGLLVVLGVIFLLFKDSIFKTKEPVDTGVEKVAGEYRLSGEGLEDFDLVFLKLENKQDNVVYSPLSIKYALEMLKEGTANNSHAQLDAIVGDYKPKKRINNRYMAFSNAMFVKNDFKSSIKSDYVNKIQNDFDAEVIYDSFESPQVLNSWVKDNTLGLVDNVYNDISRFEFLLVNALAINMEWKNAIQYEWACDDNYNNCDTLGIDYYIEYAHAKTENAEYDYPFVGYLGEFDSESVELNFDGKMETIAPAFEAVINNYDIVKTLGEDNIRQEVKDALRKWKEENPDMAFDYEDEDAYLDKFIEELNTNYQHNGYSTDFYVYDDEEVKAFAKNLKTYNGTTLQYVGIMPKKEELNTFINSTNAKDLSNIINNLKDVSKASEFEDGYFTYVHGKVPLFSFDYKLDIMNDLKSLGITDIFGSKADLSKLTTDDGIYIDDVTHKATIDFSNRGIKAGAVTSVGGAGDESDGFDYFFKMPTKEIDLTFDKPYMFLIRDVDTGEIWFAGSVYNPTKAPEIIEEY